jgi:hypothetical protein
MDYCLRGQLLRSYFEHFLKADIVANKPLTPCIIDVFRKFVWVANLRQSLATALDDNQCLPTPTTWIVRRSFIFSLISPTLALHVFSG